MEPSGHPHALAAVKSLRTLLNTKLFGHLSWCDGLRENNFNTARSGIGTSKSLSLLPIRYKK
jgi:hypothetical protein